MPYADSARQREAVKVWQESHPEKLKAYRKTMFSLRSGDCAMLRFFWSLPHWSDEDQLLHRLLHQM